MKKYFFFVCILLIVTQSSFSQSFRTYFGLGGMYHKFQDTRYSDLSLNKLTIQPEIGFSYESELNYYLANINARAYDAVHPATDTTKYSSLQFDVRFGYLREISPNLLIGGTWDIIDHTTYEQSDLQNNNNTFINLTVTLLWNNVELDLF